MAKKYDVVSTSKLAAEDIASYNVVEYVANGNIEQGRLCELDHTTKKVAYASANTVEDLYLSASVEKFYEGHLGLTEFINLDGKKMRAIKLVQGDEFGTSAADVANITVGTDLAVEAATGNLITATGTEAVLFTVIEKGYQGSIPVLFVRVK